MGRILASLDGAVSVANCTFKNFILNSTYFLFNFFNSECFVISDTNNNVFSATFEDLLFFNSVFNLNSGMVSSDSSSMQFLFKNINIDSVTSGKVHIF